MKAPVPKDAPPRGRPRNSKKAEAVLHAACRHFSVLGFDGTSMDDVAKAADVAKATVYAKFGSKTELFLAALEELRRSMPSPQEVMAGPTDDVPAHLRVIAGHLLRLTLGQSVIGIFRMLVLPMESAPGLGKQYWEQSVAQYRKAMQDVLHEADRRGLLSVPDPARAVSHFFSLVTGDPMFRTLLTSRSYMSTKEEQAHVEAAVALFLAGYRRLPGSAAHA